VILVDLIKSILFLLIRMTRSFDVIGSKEKSVAIVEIREDDTDEKQIAEEIMQKNKNVKSVLKKESARGGEFRTRQYTLIAGDADTEVVHKEHGYSIIVDPQKAYFSSREGTERQRIAKQVKANEVVMIMFAGVGPYAVAVGKTQPDVEKVVAIEINPDAVEYMKQNIRINKLAHKVVPVIGDVSDAAEKWFGKCNHVVMPLPLGSGEFLDVAVRCAKKGGIVHFYSRGNEADGDVYSAAEKIIAEKLEGGTYEIIDKRIVLPYAPGKFKVCIEFKIL